MELIVEKLLEKYNIESKSIKKLGDTSRGEADIRVQYIKALLP